MRSQETLEDLPREVLDSLHEGCQVVGPDYRYLYLNDAAATHGRNPKEDLLERTMMEAYPGIEDTEMFAVLKRCMEERVTLEMENEFAFPDGSKGWFELRFEPVPRGVAILSVDVSRRKRAELALSRSTRALTVLSECNQTLVRATDEQAFLPDVCRIVVEEGGYAMAWVGLKKPGERWVTPVASAGRDEGYTGIVRAAWDDSERGLGPVGRSIQTGDVSVVRFVASDPDFVPWRDEALARGFRSVIVLPIRDDGHILGALAIYAAEPDAFDAAERKLLEEMALDLGYGISVLRARVARRQAEQRVRHLNAVLRGIRDVNQLITCERDPQALIERACSLLVESRGFATSCIALCDGTRIEAFAQAGSEGRLGALSELLRSGELPECMRAALDRDGVVVREDPASTCEGCPVNQGYAEPRDAAVVRLASEGTVLGALLVSLSPGMVTDEEELDLLREVAGDLAFALVSIRNEAAKRRAELALNRAETRYQALVANLQDVVFSMDADGRIEYVSPAVERVYGFSPSDVLGRHFSEFVEPEDQPAFADSFERSLRGVVEAHEFHGRDKSGRLRYLRSTSHVREEDGRVAGVDGLIIDFTELRQAQDALRASAERWSATFDAITDIVCVISNEHTIAEINRAGCAALGLPREEALGSKCFELVHGGGAPIPGCPCSVSGKSVDVAHSDYEQDGRSYELTAWPVLGTDGNIEAFVHVVKEVTSRVEAERALRAGEARFRSLLNAVSEVVWAAKPDGSDYFYLSPSVATLYGRSAEAFSANPSLWLDVVHPEDRDRVMTHAGELRSLGRVEDVYRIVRPNGDVRWVHDRKAIMRDEAGTPEQIGGIATDVTEQVLAQQALEASERGYRSLFENASVGIARCRMLFEGDEPMDFEYLDVNPAFRILTGLDNVVGKWVTEVIPGIRESDPGLFETYGRVARSGVSERFEIHLDSLQQWFDVSVYSTERDHFVAVFDVITKRKQTEANLVAFSRRLERLTSVVQDLSQARSVEAIVEIVRHAARGLVGSDGATFVLRDRDLCHYVDEDAIAPLWKGKRFPLTACISGWAMLNRQPAVIEDIYADSRIPRDAYEPTFVKSLVMVPIRRQSPIGAIGSYWAKRYRASDEDVRILQALADSTSVAMENVRFMGELEEGKARVRAIYDHLPTPTFAWRHDGGGLLLSDVNDAARTATKGAVERFLGAPAAALGHVFPDIEKDLASCFERHASIRREAECNLPGADGTRRLVLTYGFIPADMVILLTEDVTELRQTEDQLRLVQRLEAVGRLAGGVAHDFNNLLSVIISNAAFAIDELRDDDPVRADVIEIQKAGERAAALTRQLLAFSRKQVLEPELVDVNKVVTGIESMLRRLLGEDMAIETHLAQDLGSVLADPGQLEQVLMNLAVNARDAMPRGGKLTIETAGVELDEDYAEQHVSVTPGRFIMLAVTDTGVGMDAETKAHIFEPFFTTKEAGKGTGLGLAMVYGIVKQSSGNVWVYSEPGRGTTFKVYLPRVDAPAAEIRRRSVPVRASGNETVLVVEDEDGVRRLAERILRRVGYQVLVAQSGAEALAVCERHAGPIDLLLTDVVMPEMSGRDLAERLIERLPRIAVLYMSGYTDNAIVHHGILDQGTRFIGKPFSAAELTRKVHEVLDETTRGDAPHQDPGPTNRGSSGA